MQLNEVIQRIQKAGADKASAEPMSGGKKWRIVLQTPAGRATLKDNLTQAMAEDIIRQATNRVILG